jgi:hypothetical protein
MTQAPSRGRAAAEAGAVEHGHHRALHGGDQALLAVAEREDVGGDDAQGAAGLLHPRPGHEGLAGGGASRFSLYSTERTAASAGISV